MSSWDLILILNNLSLGQPFENDYLALTPITDKRVKRLIDAHKKIKKLTNGFTDQFSRKVDPAVLLLEKDAPSSVRKMESLVAFRNIFAICVIIEAWVDFVIKGWFSHTPNHSNYFDFIHFYLTRYTTA